MQNGFHHQLLVAQALFQKKVVAQTCMLGLLPGQSKILDYLDSHDGCEQKSLGEIFCLEPATVTGILRRMEQAGLIERRGKSGNRKSNYVFLTEKGKTAAAAVKEIFRECETAALESVSEAEQALFLEILQKISQNLTKEANS